MFDCFAAGGFDFGWVALWVVLCVGLMFYFVCCFVDVVVVYMFFWVEFVNIWLIWLDMFGLMGCLLFDLVWVTS